MSDETRLSKFPIEEQLRMIWEEIMSITERLRKLEAEG